MTEGEQIRLLVQRHAWALQELYYDEMICGAQVLCANPVKLQFGYLRDLFGSGNAVLARLRRTLAEYPLKSKIELSGTSQEILNRISKEYAWVFDEVIVDEAEATAVQNFASANTMFQHLRLKMSLKELLGGLTWLVTIQKDRRKTLRHFAHKTKGSR
jgi:hypothetical protein